MNILEITGLTKTYKSKCQREKTVLKDFDFRMGEGEFTAFMGPSGSGKTTLLNIISKIDQADAGTIVVQGETGMVFQDFHLIDSLNMRDNIILPMTLKGKYNDEIEEQLQKLIAIAQIEEILEKYPCDISGGEKQRAAICRALVNEPALLLADEPTGNLDLQATNHIMQYFTEISATTSILMVTHDAYAASYCKRVVFFQNGKIRIERIKKCTRNEFFQNILSTMAEMGV